MPFNSRGLALGGHDNCFLIVDRVGQDFVVGVRAHTGEVSTVYLMGVDIEKLVKFLSQSPDLPAEMRLLPARHTVGETVIGFSETGE
jgi:hypothetical protein